MIMLNWHRLPQPATRARKQLELLSRYLRLLRRSADQQSFMPLVDRVGQIRQLVIAEGEEWS